MDQRSPDRRQQGLAAKGMDLEIEEDLGSKLGSAISSWLWLRLSYLC